MEKLKKTRESRGISQRALAKRAGISFRCVQQLEEPDHNWRVESMNLALKHPEDVYKIIEEFYPKKHIPPKTQFFIEEIFE